MSNYHAIQCINTKWLPPTNHRDQRIKATCDAGSITVEIPQHQYNQQVDFHREIALKLAAKFDWEWVESEMVTGGFKHEYFHMTNKLNYLS